MESIGYHPEIVNNGEAIPPVAAFRDGDSEEVIEGKWDHKGRALIL